MSKTAYLFIFVFFVIAALPAGSLASAPPLAPGSRIALLPPGGDAESSQKLKRQTEQSIARAFRQMGHRVMGPNEVSRTLEQEGADACQALRSCDQQAVLRALGVDAVASVALWLDEKGAEPHKVVVRITRPENWGVGDALVGEAGFDGAIGAAAAMALKDTEKRHLVTLRIEAEPADARVEVDHKRAGLAPAQVEVLPGRRAVTVSASGYITESDFVEVPDDTSRVVVHRVRLSPDTKFKAGANAVDYPAGPDPYLDLDGEAPASGNASVWNYVAGGVLIAASIPLTVFPLVTAARQDECYEQDQWGRCSRYCFGTQSSFLLAGGLLALGGGIALIVLHPIAGPDGERNSVAGNGPSLALEASPFSARLRGEF
jgi:hypothetical protein